MEPLDYCYTREFPLGVPGSVGHVSMYMVSLKSNDKGLCDTLGYWRPGRRSQEQRKEYYAVGSGHEEGFRSVQL